MGDYGDQYRLLRNVDSSGNGWIQFRLDGGETVNRDALGSVVYVDRPGGLRSRHRLFSGDAIGAGSERLIHAGVGTSTTVDVEVVWPDGAVLQLEDLPTGRRYRVVHPASELILGTSFESQ